MKFKQQVKSVLVGVLFISVAQANINDGARPTPSPSPISGSEHVDAISNQYIVKFSKSFLLTHDEDDKAGPTRREFFIQAAEDLAQSYGGEMLAVYHHTIQGFLMKSNHRSAVESMAQDSRVAAIHADMKSASTGVQFNPTWGLDRIDQSTLPLNQTYQYENTGNGVNVYVFDTGTINHPDFAGRVTPGPTFVTGSGSAGGCSVGPHPPGTLPPPMCFSDCNGHGTHVAGTIGSNTWGVAKGVNIQPIKVLDCNSNGQVSDIIAGIDWLLENYQAPALVNMSLGSSEYVLNDDQDMTIFEEAIHDLLNRDIAVVASAGNSDGFVGLLQPASIDEVITVAATDEYDHRWQESDHVGSNYGSLIDVFAPGKNVLSAEEDGGSGFKTGTSMSAPHVTGALAMYLESHPNASPADLSHALVSTATEGVVVDPGYGTPNKMLNVAALLGVEPVSAEPDYFDDITQRGYTDDTPGDAYITYSGSGAQEHNFHDQGDEDWLIFALGFDQAIELGIYSDEVDVQVTGFRVDGEFETLDNGRYVIEPQDLTEIEFLNTPYQDNAFNIVNRMSEDQVYVIRMKSSGTFGPDTNYTLYPFNLNVTPTDDYDNLALRGYNDNLPGDAVVTPAGQMFIRTVHEEDHDDWSIFALGAGDKVEFTVGNIHPEYYIGVNYTAYRVDGAYEDNGDNRWIIEQSDLFQLAPTRLNIGNHEMEIHNTTGETQVYLVKTSYIDTSGYYRFIVNYVD